MDPMELTPIGYRYKEAGKLLTVSEPTVIRLIQAGKLERLQVTENRFVVSRESLSAYMEGYKQQWNRNTRYLVQFSGHLAQSGLECAVTRSNLLEPFLLCGRRGRSEVVAAQ